MTAYFTVFWEEWRFNETLITHIFLPIMTEFAHKPPLNTTFKLISNRISSIVVMYKYF